MLNQTVGVYGGKFFPPHIGHLSFIYQAATEVDKLYVVVQYDLEHEAKLVENTNFKIIDPKERVAWLSEELRDYPNIHVLAQYEHRSDEHLTDPLCGETYKELTRMVGGKIDVVFSNTHEYDEYFNTWLPGVTHRVMLENRDIHDISATEIRAKGIYASWDYLPKAVQRAYLKRVCLVGWESTGKTFTSKIIAKIMNTTYVEEYGRTYYEEKGAFSTIDKTDDYVEIAAGHLHALHYAQGNKLIVMDTDLVYTQFFHMKQHGFKNPILELMIENRQDKIDYYLFLEPHNALHQDGSRYEQLQDERQQTSDKLKELYLSYGRELIVINEADNHTRLTTCLNLVDQYVHNQ